MKNFLTRILAAGAIALSLASPAPSAIAAERAQVPASMVVPAGSTLRGVSGTASAITYTVVGTEQSSSTETYKVLAQGQLPSGVNTIYTAPAGYTGLVSSISLVNTTALAVNAVKLFVGGDLDANRVLNELTIPANGGAYFSAGSWIVIDAGGQIQTSGSGGGGGGGGSSYFAGTGLNLIGTTFNFSPSTDVTFNSHKITDLIGGSNPNEAATFGQLSAAIEGRQDKDASNWCTTGDISLSGLGTQANGEWTGTLAGTERILVKGQSAQSANGLYVPASGAWARTPDANTAAEVTKGATTLVTAGATCSNKSYTQNLIVTTLGTDSQSWVLTSTPAVYSAGAGLLLTGTAFSINSASVTNAMLATANDLTLKCNISGGVATPIDCNRTQAQANFVNPDGTILKYTSNVLRIEDGSLDYVKLTPVTAPAFTGRITAGSGSKENLTPTQATSMLDVATSSLKGLESAADKSKLDAIYGAMQLTASGGGAVGTCRGNVTGAVTVETFLCGAKINASTVAIGDVFRVVLVLQSSSTGTFTGRIRVGAAGTVLGDTQISISAASAAGVASRYIVVEAFVHVVALGASATVGGTIQGGSGTARFQATDAAEVLANVNTAANWFIDVSGASSVGTYTVRAAEASRL